ncbi:MAG: Uma2 family endonuclease [Chromatiaceae bacterium]|nr:Uma2 family endonuclease [Chromatiaceae bacterium]MCF7995001.1 Uma2 family endonuclease [Chromatiaceae bacterium]MCF8004850.1 Uma2 family endonuclease [Chromatiaceae bacterium]MCF8015996.1 Uma2 family endonuclease [Chromatiaceae bacterium]
MSQWPIPDEQTASVEPVSADGQLVSEAEYWQDWYNTGDLSYEWNNGRLEEKPVSDFETFQVYLWFLELLRHYLRLQPIGKLVALEMGFRLALRSGTVIRKPDLAVVLDTNPVALDLTHSSYHGVFDLCVEALSTEKPAYVHRDLVVKKAEYAAGGVPEYYVLHREHGNLAFYGRTRGSSVYSPLPTEGSGDDRLVRSRILPGFQFRVSDLIRRPDLDAIRRDPVYSSFVLPEWTRAEQEQVQAEQARLQAERAQAQAEQARLQAERAQAQAEQARLRAEHDRDKASRERDEALAEARREVAARAALEAELASLRNRSP